MIPNDFGLIRQKDHNLFALLFPTLTDISEYHIEVLYVDPDQWINNKAVTGSTATDRLGMKYAIVDIRKYDYILAPASSIEMNGVYNGTMNTDTISETINRFLVKASNKHMSVYAMIEVKNNGYLLTNQRLNDNMPIIGFIRHRSDNVNPKGIIKDVNSDLLQPVKEDELNGEADRIRDELPGNAESPDLDSKSGSGADERADSQAGR